MNHYAISMEDVHNIMAHFTRSCLRESASLLLVDEDFTDTGYWNGFRGVSASTRRILT